MLGSADCRVSGLELAMLPFRVCLKVRDAAHVFACPQGGLSYQKIGRGQLANAIEPSMLLDAALTNFEGHGEHASCA